MTGSGGNGLSSPWLDTMGPVPTIEPIRLGIDGQAPADRAWAAITEPELVARWFAEVTPLGAVGDPYRIDFGDGSLVEGRVLTVDTGQSFAYEWGWRDDDPRLVSRVAWQVRGLPDGGARVELVHDGWTEAGADEAMRDDHEAYWSGYLDDLQALLDEAPSAPAAGVRRPD